MSQIWHHTLLKKWQTLKNKLAEKKWRVGSRYENIGSSCCWKQRCLFVILMICIIIISWRINITYILKHYQGLNSGLFLHNIIILIILYYSKFLNISELHVVQKYFRRRWIMSNASPGSVVCTLRIMYPWYNTLHYI